MVLGTGRKGAGAGWRGRRHDSFLVRTPDLIEKVAESPQWVAFPFSRLQFQVITRRVGPNCVTSKPGIITYYERITGPNFSPLLASMVSM